MYKNKSPFSHTNQNQFNQHSNNYPSYQPQILQSQLNHHHQRQSRSPISVDLPVQQNMGNLMFGQTLKNKGKNNSNNNGYNDVVETGMYRNGNISNSNISGFSAMSKKNTFADIDAQLGCDQVLHKTKQQPLPAQLQFICNQQLTPISKTNTSKQYIQQNRRQTQRRQNPTSIPLLDLLKCNQQLPQKQKQKQKQNVNLLGNYFSNGEYDEIYKRMYNLLQSYKKSMVQMQDQNYQLKSQLEMLLGKSIGK